VSRMTNSKDAELAIINAKLGCSAPAPFSLQRPVFPQATWSARHAPGEAVDTTQDMDRELEQIERRLTSIRSARGKPPQGSTLSNVIAGDHRPTHTRLAEQQQQQAAPPQDAKGSVEPAESARVCTEHLRQQRREATYEEFALGKGRAGGGGEFWWLHEGSQAHDEADPFDVFQIWSEAM
jgi:hypothetical protein